MNQHPGHLLQRTFGRGRLSAKRGVRGMTRIDRLYQEGAARIRVPDHLGRTDLEAVIINTAGGVTGGDALAWDTVAGMDTHLTVTTQACEKVYKANAGTAQIDVRLKVEAGARLHWLPQETILFDRASLTRTIDADLDEAATLLLVEPMIFGRRAMDEVVQTGLWHDTWRIRHKGALVHADNIRLQGAIAEHLDSPAGLQGRTALATLALFGNDAEAKLEGTRALLETATNIDTDASGTIGGASFWKAGGADKLIVRLAARDGYALRQSLIPLINHLAAEPGIVASPAVPKIWSL